MSKITDEVLIKRCILKHGDKYDYSLTKYNGVHSKIIIICKIHGLFTNIAKNRYRRGDDCPNCTRNRTVINGTEIIPKDAKIIPLTRGKYAIVDEEDYERVMQHIWYVSGRLENSYASTNINDKIISMHRFIMNVTDPKITVDHIFHNTLDNRKSQLRVCTQRQNTMNQRPQKGCSSKYKGVSWWERDKKWKACIRVNEDSRKTQHLGYFTDEEEAARAYDTKARELHGEFAYLNFPDL